MDSWNIFRLENAGIRRGDRPVSQRAATRRRIGRFLQQPGLVLLSQEPIRGREYHFYVLIAGELTDVSTLQWLL